MAPKKDPVKVEVAVALPTKVKSDHALPEQQGNKEKPKAYTCRVHDDPFGNQPDFIYGGPFILIKQPEPLLEIDCPVNIEHSGAFKKSYAYHSLKERLPVILTKVIDYTSREGGKVGQASDVTSYVSFVAKLKSDLVTNKNYDKFTHNSEECEKWNQWLDDLQQTTYYTNTFLFTESYIYRKLREGCELYPSLANYDPFAEQKTQAFTSGLEPMCILAAKMPELLQKKEKPDMKNDYVLLLKLSVWANKCDMSHSLGKPVNLLSGAQKDEEVEELKPNKAIDPIQMLAELPKDRTPVDMAAKAFENLYTKSEKISNQIEAKKLKPFKERCSCERLAKLAGWPIYSPPPEEETPLPPPPVDGEKPEPPKIPCPSKLVVPTQRLFDIVLDNVGYELFVDLCIGTWIIQHELVDKIRFHTKKYPWFVSDATKKDFMNMIDMCASASYNRTVQPDPPKPAKGQEDEPPPEVPPIHISADGIRSLASQWKQYVDNGTFIVTDEEFWTYPHPFKDMKRIDPNLYRMFQYSCGALFKGDLNYRKLMGERNTNPYAKMLECLQGFQPCPLTAARCIKSEIICGMPKGKFELLTKNYPGWMVKGEFGMVQFCPKAEKFKPAVNPCIDYGETCFSKGCPEHTDI